jgi:hypothetical protein
MEIKAPRRVRSSDFQQSIASPSEHEVAAKRP